jgi:hypothetical protein
MMLGLFLRGKTKYRRICELAELSYVYYFSLILRIVIMGHDYVETTH